jgi:hypothetical protein
MELFMNLSHPSKLNIRSSLVVPASLALLLTCSADLLADDVSDQIDEAVKAYEKEDYNTAITALDSASTLIRQKKGELVSNHLTAGRQMKAKAVQPLPGCLVVVLVQKNAIQEKQMVKLKQ